MTPLHTIFRACYSLSPRLANYIKKRIKGERDVWELTWDEVESCTFYPKSKKKNSQADTRRTKVSLQQ